MNDNDSPRTDVLDDDGAPQRTARRQPALPTALTESSAQSPSPMQGPVPNSRGNASSHAVA
jgi:hypothetical protein